MAAGGYISEKHAAFALIALVFFVAMIRIGGSLGQLIRFLFRVALPIASLLTLVIVFGKGNWNEMGGALSSLLVLLAMLFGFYVMFGGLFHRR